MSYKNLTDQQYNELYDRCKQQNKKHRKPLLVMFICLLVPFIIGFVYYYPHDDIWRFFASFILILIILAWVLLVFLRPTAYMMRQLIINPDISYEDLEYKLFKE